MAEVSFYILPTQSSQQRTFFACRLIEKAYRNKQFCYIYTETAQQSQQLDNQLWTFRAGSFVPHQIFDNTVPEFVQTMLIGTEPAPEHWQKIIINLSSNCPQYFEQTDRIIEILDKDEQIKQAGRIRYRQYQQDGLDIKTYNI